VHSTLSAFVLPSPHAVRPSFCPHCRAIAGEPGSFNLWSHDIRWRDVVLPGRGADDPVVLVQTWVRRFQCQRCEGTCSVSPPEVLPRHIYTLPAIILAWFRAVDPPLGDGRDDAAVCARMGVDRPLTTQEAGRAGHRRWRSLARWVASAAGWWPTRPLPGTTWRQQAASLLLGFLAGDGGRDGATRRAVSAHVAGGTAM
jgi:hypothetical protein